MKRRNVLIAVMLVGFLVMVGVTAAGQKKRVKSSEATKTKKAISSEATETKKVKPTEATKIHLKPGPELLLSKAKELELTESQQARLIAIMKEMHAKANAVLTEAQVAKVKTWKPVAKLAQKMKTTLHPESTKPSGTKTKIVKASDDTKSQAKK